MQHSKGNKFPSAHALPQIRKEARVAKDAGIEFIEDFLYANRQFWLTLWDEEAVDHAVHKVFEELK